MSKQIVIVGVGALGSHVALALRNAGGLTLIDFDRVEQKNLLSQWFGQQALRRNKAQAMAQALFGMFRVKATAVPHRLEASNIEYLLGGADLVLDCTDNAEARTLIQGYCRDRVACLHGALSAADQGFGRVMWLEHFSPDSAGAGEATCEDGRQLPFIQLVSALLARTAQAYLETGTKHSYQVIGLVTQRVA